MPIILFLIGSIIIETLEQDVGSGRNLYQVLVKRHRHSW
jgi:hypothetical protein